MQTENDKVKKISIKIGVVELFAGISRLRLELERTSKFFDTAWANQWEPGKTNKWEYECYVEHFGQNVNNVNKDISVVINSVPEHDIDEARKVWQQSKNLVKNNELVIDVKYGYPVKNFPLSRNDKVSHVRQNDTNAIAERAFLSKEREIINYMFLLEYQVHTIIEK